MTGNYRLCPYVYRYIPATENMAVLINYSILKLSKLRYEFEPRHGKMLKKIE